MPMADAREKNKWTCWVIMEICGRMRWTLGVQF
ncbi:hypothetical protein chiPu_0024130, partial [Chiloscyllium punctatum]|nr:hypothetical protein [Chiloscyllium punctatum]